ncbi:hypothetical protein E5676_scaffold289G00860 [Cucumis melo var. makuwa]|uniref:Uncharacterized protein n=1 Tax=Cucumis melo var. makuwa TaxID=1194695 RepID=A0A5D3DX15_CUCMM|nr:hypothetical protein E5676_scaffold289G00860 [Cucumis melo var. makuwa]
MHVGDSPSDIEAAEELFFQLFPTVNYFRLQIGIPLESIFFQASNKFPDQLVSSTSCIFTCFNKMSNVLFWIVPSTKLLKLWRLVPTKHSQIINSFGIWLKVHERSLSRSFILSSYKACVIISCNCWTDKEVIEMDCCVWFSCNTTFPLS